jgi:hypothetical protein
MMRVAQTEFKRLVLSERFPEREIAQMDVESKSMDEVLKMTNRRSPVRERHADKVRKQKLVSMKALGKWIDNGWEFVQKVEDKQVIIRSPLHA